MFDRRDPRPRFLRGGEVDIGKDHTWLLACFGKDLAPWRHHDAMAEGRASVLMQAALGRGKHEGAGLDGTGARQYMPMGFSGLLREGSGDGDKLCAGRGERAIERREAEVITDAEPESAEGQ